MANKPVRVLRAGNVSVSIWENEAKQGRETRTFSTVTLQRSYRSKEETEYTQSLRLGDLPTAARLLDLAFEHLMRGSGTEQEDGD